MAVLVNILPLNSCLSSELSISGTLGLGELYVLDRCSCKLIPYIGEIGEPGTCWLFDSDNDKGENGHPGEADTVANTFIFISVAVESVLTTCAAEIIIKFPALAAS